MATRRRRMKIKKRTLMSKMRVTKRTNTTRDSLTGFPQLRPESQPTGPPLATHPPTKEGITNPKFQALPATNPPCKEAKLANALPTL